MMFRGISEQALKIMVQPVNPKQLTGKFDMTVSSAKCVTLLDAGTQQINLTL